MRLMIPTARAYPVRGHLSGRVEPRERMGVASLLSDWRQGDVEVGDEAVY